MLSLTFVNARRQSYEPDSESASPRATGTAADTPLISVVLLASTYGEIPLRNGALRSPLCLGQPRASLVPAAGRRPAEGSPYAGASYRVLVRLPEAYPNFPPKLSVLSIHFWRVRFRLPL